MTAHARLSLRLVFQRIRRVTDMPFVLRHRVSGEVAAAVQKNHYDLEYYGVKWWAAEEEAEQEKEQWLDGNERDDATMWDVIAIEEAKLKIGNVKLKNDPRLRLYMDLD